MNIVVGDGIIHIHNHFLKVVCSNRVSIFSLIVNVEYPMTCPEIWARDHSWSLKMAPFDRSVCHLICVVLDMFLS